MDVNAIKAAIAAKIAGQGSMVDVGGGLPGILDAICDALTEIDGKIPTGGLSVPEIAVDYSEADADFVCSLLVDGEPITAAQWQDLIGGKYPTAKITWTEAAVEKLGDLSAEPLYALPLVGVGKKDAYDVAYYMDISAISPELYKFAVMNEDGISVTLEVG